MALQMNDDMVTVRGLPWFAWLGVTEEKIDALTRLPAREDDIFIASFVRSGSTWTQEIVWQLLDDGKIDGRRLDVRVPFFEGMILPVKSFPYTMNKVKSIENRFASFPVPRVFKTHLFHDLVPKCQDEAAKPQIIYVMRNPKDVCVSLYHHYINMPYMTGITTWEDAFERFINGKVIYGSWFDHVLSWWNHRDDPNVLFLKYEDRIKNPANAVEKIARFIGKELSPSTRDLIVQQTSFSAMKSSEHTNYTWFEGIKGDGFIRKGQVGKWKDYFTEEQNQLFDKVFKEKIEGSGLTFEFEG